jgi:polyribonucleotide nucleotidyltransferase
VVLQQCQIVMDCPPHLVGLLIGKKGWTIKKIQQETSAQVWTSTS